jgi:hypothetical protein
MMLIVIGFHFDSLRKVLSLALSFFWAEVGEGEEGKLHSKQMDFFCINSLFTLNYFVLKNILVRMRDRGKRMI